MKKITLSLLAAGMALASVAAVQNDPGKKDKKKDKTECSKKCTQKKECKKA
ncbi:hypothetical protein [Flaviaesturariibacter amylovorans]|uniref:Uncharacterized protein n=1 Tax=Flaviaesturariibacter amylovorans TaxID=1084520 RepID=A0ABP8HGY2_9BACT